MLIGTKAHGVADYATSALLLAAPSVLRFQNRRSALLLRAAGGGVLATSLLTDYELGVARKLPMPAHLALDAATGALLAGSPWLLGLRGKHAREWLPGLIVGVGEIAAAALTERRPGDRGGSAPDPATLDQQPPSMPTGTTGERMAETEPAGGLRPQIAPSPLETPGPSVNAPELPESETERRERADALTEDVDETLAPVHPVQMEDLAQASPEVLAIVADTDSEGPQTADPIERLIQQQEDAARAEAAEIGGPRPGGGSTGDPAMEPVYEAGGGDAEGWEQAEADLIENATHGDGGGNPLRDAIAPELEADRSGAVYGEGDRLPSSEVDDPDGER